MARHDREESLEEQLAWLDAIKEQEEAPVVAAKSAAVVEDAVISPYPKDPWSSVPTESDATSSPLFRAAVDSAYQPASASTTVIVPPAEDADAAEWMEVSETVSAFTVPPPSASTKQDNDGFLAPLKPLPRQEPGDADTYTPSEFTEPAIRTPYVEPEPEPSRGLFEQPHRPAELPSPSNSFRPGPSAPTPARSSPRSPKPSGSPSAARSSAARTPAGPPPAAPIPPRGRVSSRSAVRTPPRARVSSRSATPIPRRGRVRSRSVMPSPIGSPPAVLIPPRGRVSSRSAVRIPPRAQVSSRSAVWIPAGPPPMVPIPLRGRVSSRSAVRIPPRARASSRSAVPSLIGSPPAARIPKGSPTAANTTETGPSSRPPNRPRPRSHPGRRPGISAPSRSSRSGPLNPSAPTGRSAPSPDRSAPDRSAPGSFGSDFSGPQDSPGFSGFSGPSAFGRERDTAFGPSRDTPSPADRPSFDRVSFDRADRVSPDRAEQVPTGRDTVSAPERETAFAPGPDTITPAREPYQARRRQSPVPPPAFSTPSRPQVPGVPRQSADSLDPESLLKGRRNSPAGGWRKLIYKASAGLIKPGESPEVRRRRELVSRARTPVATGHHRVAVLSLKGGVGKTTTTVGLGATLAQVRGDRVIAVDANPDRGTLSDKVELETSATVRDLLNERQQIKRYVDIRAFTSQAPSRLEILASDRDPSVSEAFSASDYQSVSQVLENFYSICITDCGTGLLHSAMSGVLGLADQLVLVSSPSVDGARAASATLDWLEAHHYEDLVRSATVVLCSVRPRSKSTVDLDRLEAHFAARCRAVIRVPYDPHLEEGAEIDLERLQPATRESYLRLAASVGDGFAGLQS
ncbi:AAA family ATPase [Streptosporangium lutulentum]